MFNSKTRTALALAVATLGIVFSAVPAQAAVARPPALRLQGAATTVTMFRPAGTRNVYLRATTIKRTLKGIIMRTITGVPIKVTLTRTLIRDAKVVAKVSAGATGQGASQAECDSFADLINAWDNLIAAGIAVDDGTAGVQAMENSEEATDAALDAGCFVILS